jgi:hypothetical protein
VKARLLMWRLAGALAAVAGLAAMRWVSIASLDGSASGGTSLLRLSFSARPERIERCVELSDEELAKLPAHMRLRTTCEGYSARYALTVSVGDRLTMHDTLRGGGLRHDRALHVFREQAVEHGLHRFRIEVVRVDEGGTATRDDADTTQVREQRAEGADTLLGGRADRERDERARRAAEAMPQRLVMDTVLAIPAMRVLLVTFDNSARRLVARLEP